MLWNEIDTVQLGIIRILTFYLPPFFFPKKKKKNVKDVDYFMNGTTVLRSMKWCCEWKFRFML